MNELIIGRLAQLRQTMADRGIDYYLIPTADFHNSEYVSDYFKVREYFSNFSGSAGTLLVWKDGAGLWTDGRYFIQAEAELEGTTVELFRMMDAGVPTIEEFLKKNMHSGETLGFDGRCVTAGEGKKYENLLLADGGKIKLSYSEDLAEDIWKDRPEFPVSQLFTLDVKMAGKSVADKLSEVRQALSESGAQGLFLTKLDDIMWLYNIRANDVECNPVAMSYAYIGLEDSYLFIQPQAVNTEADLFLKFNGIMVRDYASTLEFLKEIKSDNKVLVDENHVNFCFYKTIADRCTVVNGKNPTEKLKAIKNPVELENMRVAYMKDNVALTKFIYWLKTNIGKIPMTECSVADKLESFRREIPEFIELSFGTISAYKGNAAMMHYDPTPDNCAELKPEGMLLVDSGGQYMGGTTDVTRTIVLGPISEAERRDFTLVLAGQLTLTNAHWLYGCSGKNLDILARKPLWDRGLDYKCGTGHGVGYIMNVHEGPHSMRWRPGAADVCIEPGMDVTNEPGVYIEGQYGIRTENVMVAANDYVNEYGQFMKFETLTWVPIDMGAVDKSLLSPEQLQYLVDYQETTYEKLSPYLSEEERIWLRQETTV